MTYTKQTWHDEPTEDTPLSAARLGHMEDGIYDASSGLAGKADTSALAAVATSGDYSDLGGTPTIPASYSDLTGSVPGADQTYGTTADTACEGNDSRLSGNVPTTRTVNGHALSADVTVTASDVGLGNVDNTNDAHKPVSTATQTALDLKADTSALADVATSGAYSDLTGSPTIPDALTDLDTTVTGTQLNSLKSKVDGIAAGAEINVQSDWDASSGDAEILNKPTLGTAAATASTAYATAAQGALAASATQPGDLAAVATSGAYSSLSGTPSIPDALTDLDTTVTGAQLNADHAKLAGVAAGAQVNTVEDLGDLGLTASATELNYVDGVTSAIQTQLNGKVAGNSTITGATQTKITYDTKGLVTAGSAATQDDIGDGSTYKRYSATEKTKLAGIATSATANSTDATLENRANHTGTQSADTITDGTTNKAYTATEKTKLAGVEASADVTDATNVAAAGAVMGSGSAVGLWMGATLPGSGSTGILYVVT